MADGATKATQRPLLERFGLAYFKRRAAALPKVEAMDEIHVLNPDELRALRRIERGVIVRAALAGALSALVSSVTEVLCLPMLGPDPDNAPWAALLPFYGIVFGVTIVATVFEIGFLYWDSLRSVHELARAAGLDLFEGGPEEDKHEVAAALARAAGRFAVCGSGRVLRAAGFPQRFGMVIAQRRINSRTSSRYSAACAAR